jgi:predicted ribosomally synthesized peptide with SipW-like signal peptide
VGGALSLAFGGAFATFTDTVSAGPQTISSGKIVIATGPTNTAGTAATAIVPGDTITREIDLNSTGSTANDASITLGFTATTSSLLNTDAANGLHLTVSECSVAPTVAPPVYTCGGTTTAVLASTPVSALIAAPVALPGLKSLVAGGKDYLLFTLTFPATAPGNIAANPALCAGAGATENMEGCTSVLTYNFLATQRAGAAQ